MSLVLDLYLFIKCKKDNSIVLMCCSSKLLSADHSPINTVNLRLNIIRN